MADTLVAMTDAAMRDHPDRVAVIDVDGTTTTHRELDRLANGFAATLHAHGVGPGDRVGVCRRKSAGTVAGLVGIMRAGAAYVPVDPSSPIARNRTIFDDCEVSAVLLDEDDLRVVSPGTSRIVADPDGVDGFEPGRDCVPEDLAYILYTSGSTGRPKGVCLEHRHATSFVQWCIRTFDASFEDRCSSHAPFHFDLSIMDLWMPLSTGGSVVLIGDSLARDPRSLPGFIAERGITNWYSVPSVLSLMAEHGRLPEHDHSSLRVVCFAGEVFPLPGLRRLRSLWPEPRFWNLYGPTETNVCTAHRLPDTIEDARTEPFPIGRPCDHCEVSIVDDRGAVVPDGVMGRIICRGAPVMRGYWGGESGGGGPGGADPFLEIDGLLWYDTGDLGAVDEAGDIVFHGRRDRMVKRHGYRIELGEIEAGLDAAEFLAEAAVFAVRDGGAVVIHAAVVPMEGEKASVIRLRGHAAGSLPSYMIPDRFHVLDRLPRTSTGKVDHPRLRLEAVG
ncbi:MAG: D-alanine--poly(phosphoribitol) ligase [Phycisphaerae bacterium]|nr:D-alanine--poly(phosphoribitol) ligase [Phycisphaerae bacterium]